MTQKIAVRVCAGVALFSITASVGAAPAWNASPALLARLAPEVKISAPGIGTYGIRPPRGFTLRQVNMSAIMGGGMIYLWSGPMQPDKTTSRFSVMLGTDHSGMMPGLTSASFVQMEMSSMTRTHRNPHVSAIQQGTIHGVPFARASWTGIGTRTGELFTGIFYGYLVTPNDILMEAKDSVASGKASMPLFNAAALSLPPRYLCIRLGGKFRFLPAGCGRGAALYGAAGENRPRSFALDREQSAGQYPQPPFFYV